MRCPCCKYEYIKEEYGTKKVTRIRSRGKNKGREYIDEVYGVTQEQVGDVPFGKIEVTGLSGGYSYVCYDTGRSLIILNICPKCGVTFKE